MVECGNWEKKSSYFKFENWCLNVEGFNDMASLNITKYGLHQLVISVVQA